ncbi:MAG: hypothetical protein FJY37_07395 [Betaproteobacteria bacterium]|nr:hypothetical protein [Betaproteobacteria bacterium]
MNTLARLVAACGLAALCTSQAANALVLFTDDFELEPNSSILDYDGLANWDVISGSVDLIRDGDFGLSCNAGTRCVDIDGSASQGGRMETKASFNIIQGETYRLRVTFSGNQRGGVDEDHFTMGLTALLGSVQYGTIPFDAPFFAGGFDGSNENFSGPAKIFVETDSADNIGVIFDNVILECLTCREVVSEPSTPLLIGVGLLAIGFTRRMAGS